MKPLFPFSHLPCALALAVLTATVPAAAHAGDWEKIASDHGRTVEVDASTIFDTDNAAKMSWKRAMLNDSEAKKAGYRSVRELNRYGCRGQTITTLKRIYLDNDDIIVREDTVTDPQRLMIQDGSLDEQVWRRVCGLPKTPASSHRSKKTVSNSIHRLADTAHQAALAVVPSAKAEMKPPPPRAVPIPVATADVKPAPQKASATSAPPDAMPIPMPNVPQTPAAPVVPRRPVLPATPPSQKPLDLLPPPQRGSAVHPYILPAPAKPERKPAAIDAPAPQPALSPTSSEDWGYSGATGPESWGKMRSEWKVCAEGKRQSPVDFAAARPVRVDLDPVKFDYRPTSFVIIDSPQQLRVRISESMGLEVRGQRYVLEGFTLHRPPETSIDGKTADLEAYFFHRGNKDRIAILAVQFTRGGQPNAPLQTLLNNLPLERGDSYIPQTTLDMAALLPVNPAHYLYMGSLTTPPCSEGVLWVVMKEPMTISDEQVEIFSRLHESNTRPPQPAFNRLILESR
jgi:carbonic anhydrase